MYAPLHTTCNHYFWHLLFPCQNFVRVNLPKFLATLYHCTLIVCTQMIYKLTSAFKTIFIHIADRIQLVMIGQKISLMMFVLLLSYHSRITNGQTFCEYTVCSIREFKHSIYIARLRTTRTYNSAEQYPNNVVIVF